VNTSRGYVTEKASLGRTRNGGYFVVDAVDRDPLESGFGGVAEEVAEDAAAAESFFSNAWCS
jgi:hypothetical protein